MKGQALWHHSIQRSSLEKVDLKLEHKVQIKTLYSLISLGTERLVASGQVPENLYDKMAVPYMEGDFNFPIKYGYSLVGMVSSKEHPLFAKKVHLLHPHQDICYVEEADLFVIPEEVDLKAATLASNLETALNAVWDSKVSIGDKVLVTGFGLIGSLVARLLDLMPGTSVTILEVDPSKQQLAKDLGFDTIDTISAITPDFDVAFNCSAAQEGLQSCIEATGFESKIIELSWYGNQATSIQLGGTFHQQRKQLLSSQVSNLPADRRGRWDCRRRKETVFNLLKNPIFKHHISQTLKFANVPEFFDLIRRGEASELGIAIEY